MVNSSADRRTVHEWFVKAPGLSANAAQWFGWGGRFEGGRRVGTVTITPADADKGTNVSVRIGELRRMGKLTPGVSLYEGRGQGYYSAVARTSVGVRDPQQSAKQAVRGQSAPSASTAPEKPPASRAVVRSFMADIEKFLADKSATQTQ